MGETARIHTIFGVFAALLVALLGRLGWLQLTRSAEARAKVARQQSRSEPMPAQRGAIVDRDLRVLAYDRGVLEVRAELTLRIPDPQAPGLPPDQVLPWVDEIAQALVRDPELAESRRLAERDRLRRQLLDRVARAQCAPDDVPVKVGGKTMVRRRVDFLVASEVAATAVVESLRELQKRRGSPLHFTFLRRYRRAYPDREATVGPIGFISDADLLPGGKPRALRGIEALAGLLPGEAGLRLFDTDARANGYWTPRWKAPDPPSVLHTTLDLDLQKAAQDLLAEAAQQVAAKYQTAPDWGAMLLVEIATGNVLAMASYQHGVDPKAGRFAPLQCQYQPGSAVKPLVFAEALERGVLRWDDTIDCSPNCSGAGFQIPGRKNAIHDVHVTQGRITPHDILVRSSNIGAFKVGMRLGREGLEGYLRHARFGNPTGVGIPSELPGRRPKPLAGVPEQVPERTFLAYSGPSVSIGYEIDATPAQMARAFLTLLSGRPRELRLFTMVEDDGRVLDVPCRDAGTQRHLGEPTLALVRAAMVDVVSDAPHATGKELFRQLKELGVGSGVIGGKTGTSEYSIPKKGKDGAVVLQPVRSATFAGFAPADDPRYLAVCVLQKEGASLFYGGLYAAPAAGRLLLRVLAEELADRQRVEPRVSAGAGWSAGGAVPGEQGGQALIAVQGGR